MDPAGLVHRIETDHHCEVAHLTATAIRGTGSHILSGDAYRHGQRFLVSGMLRNGMLHTVELVDPASDDPFKGL